MAISNELSILTQAEQRDLYSAPQFSIEEQRLYFSLNDVEQAECGNDSNLMIVFYVQIMPDDLVMQLHRF